MTTDAIFTDDVGAVKYHFVISQVRLESAASCPFRDLSPTGKLTSCLPLLAFWVCLFSWNPLTAQMVSWASPDAIAQAADDAKAVKWMTLPQLRKLNVRLPASSHRPVRQSLWKCPTPGLFSLAGPLLI